MNKEIKNLLRLLVDVALFCLMILGVGGAMFKFFMPDGLLKAWMSDIWQFSPGYLLVSAVLAVFAFLAIKHWLDGLNTKTFLGDLITYAWIALGLYFAVHLAVTGGW